MLNDNGKLIGDFTIAKAKDELFYMWGSSQAQKYHMRWFEQHLPPDGCVAITRFDMGMVGLSIAGPKSRAVLQALTDEDVSNAAFKFMDHRAMDIAHCPALINRVTYTGDLGYEIWVRPDYQRRLYDAIMKAGKPHGIVNFGMRALLSMRLEKNFPTWFRELRPIYGSAAKWASTASSTSPRTTSSASRPRWRTRSQAASCAVCPSMVDASDCDVLGDEPVFHKGKVVGWVTSGGYAHYVDKSLAQGYIPKELVGDDEFEIEIIGEMRKARINHEPLFDPKGEKMRS